MPNIKHYKNFEMTISFLSVNRKIVKRFSLFLFVKTYTLMTFNLLEKQKFSKAGTSFFL